MLRRPARTLECWPEGAGGEEAGVVDREVPWLGTGSLLCSQLCHGLAAWPWTRPYTNLGPSLPGYKETDPGGASDPIKLCEKSVILCETYDSTSRCQSTTVMLRFAQRMSIISLHRHFWKFRKSFLPPLLFQPSLLLLLLSLLIKINCSLSWQCPRLSPEPFQGASEACGRLSSPVPLSYVGNKTLLMFLIAKNGMHPA